MFVKYFRTFECFTGKSVYIPCHTVGYQMQFFRLTATYLCILQGVHLIGCASYTVCIITDFSPDQTVQRLMHRCNAGELPDASRHHQCITTSGADTPLTLVWVEHDALYICVWCSEYSSICRATWCISAWYLDIISASAAVPGGASPNHDQTPLIGLMHLISSPQCEGVKHICSKCYTPSPVHFGGGF